jgi:DNA polymerase III epsilon subunit-like protein
MKYLSIDIETTGLNPKTCDILQFAAVLDDTSNPKPIEDLPRFEAIFIQDSYKGDPFALSMHSEIFKKIAISRKKNLEYCPDNNIHFMIIDFLPTALASFLLKNDFSFSEKNSNIYINIAGKNVSSFDIPFLNAKIKDWEGICFLNRSIDPAILYFDLENDVSLPDMKTCMQRAGIDGEVAHTAMEDALVVVKLLRNKFFKEGNDVLRKKEQKKKDNRS